MLLRVSPLNRRRLRAGLLWRIFAVLATAGIALAAFQLGVGVSDRSGIPESVLSTKIYYVIGLFFLGGLDLGMPVGGPNWARSLLWITYFAAPAVTTGAIIEGLLVTVRPEWWERRGLRDHLVIVGAGRLGMLYLEAVRDVDPRRRVLLMGLEQDLANVAEARTRFGVRFQQGDIRHQAARRALRLDRASGVVVITNHDLVNLDAATAILADHPRLRDRIVVHVSDLTLARAVTEQAARSREALLSPERIFNSHRIAGEHLVRHELAEYFSATEALDVVVLAGFGRFGQTILEVLQKEAAGEVKMVVIVDLEAEKRFRQFRAEVGLRGGWKRQVLDGDLADPGTWDLVTTCLEFEQPDGAEPLRPVYIVGSNNDEVNLHTAIWLRKRDPHARIVTRCFHASGFTRSVARDANLDVFGVADLLRDSLGRRHQDWFPR
jgi:voltage-gated potassium channel Kch